VTHLAKEGFDSPENAKLFLQLDSIALNSPLLSEVHTKLGAVVEKFRELVTKSGSNITLPQSANLADQLRNLTQSGGFKKLTQLLPELSQLGINETAIKNLQQKGGTDLPGVVQKLKDLYQVIP